jgi:hypothetical protein
LEIYSGAMAAMGWSNRLKRIFGAVRGERRVVDGARTRDP